MECSENKKTCKEPLCIVDHTRILVDVSSCAELIKEALTNSSKSELTSKEIFQSVSSSHPQYKYNQEKLKSMIKHTLQDSWNRGFSRVTKFKLSSFKLQSTKVRYFWRLATQENPSSVPPKQSSSPTKYGAKMIREAFLNSDKPELTLKEICETLKSRNTCYQVWSLPNFLKFTF